MGFNAFFAVGIGAAIGAWMRWGLSIWLNPVLPSLPLGTLSANLIGGYLIGIAAGFFANAPNLAPELRLLIITGFLGGLTTFSSFSVEAVGLIARQQYGWAMSHILGHLLGSLAMTALGIWTISLIRG
ncbi:MAG TPA: fluoride efflux transporter CrcB [Methylophilaceae bacterium]